ncbi:alpha/beta hydrolase [Kitasatospora sp. NPDC008050]|uniref:alpha/beta hydrolase n=1 Tax=Kitasatospora sp. NPDC008050 TaxID=3364021 RepID=UPI0036EA907E
MTEPAPRGSTARRTRPPFDPELGAVLAALPEEIRAVCSIGPDDIPAFRAMNQGMRPDPAALTRGGAVTVEERVIPGTPGGPELPVLILRPTRGPGPWPAVYHVHGGGLVSGDQWEQADTLAEWVDLLGVVAVAVGYRLAPEHPYPAPVEDCYAGLVWTAAHAEALAIDPDRLIIWGSSAGGGLAAATALLARDRGGPALSHQILQCPMLDDRELTSSSQELDGEGFWDRHSNRTGWQSLLGPAAGGPDVPAYAAPARAEDLGGLPPAFIDVGQVETFRDEALDYAARLSRAGVPVELHMWPGAWHGFAVAAPQAAVSQLAIAARSAYLRRVLS